MDLTIWNVTEDAVADTNKETNMNRNRSLSPMTSLLVAINVIYGLVLASKGWSTTILYQWGAMHGQMPTSQPLGTLPPLTILPESLTNLIPNVMNFDISGVWLIIIRSINASFLQFSWTHLISNVLSLLILGIIFESLTSYGILLPVYLFTGSVSMIAAYLIQPNSLTAGASGAIFGIMGAIVIMSLRAFKRYKDKSLRYSTYAAYKSAFDYVLGLVVMNLIVTFTTPGISIVGHIFGLLAGLIIGLVLPVRNID